MSTIHVVVGGFYGSEGKGATTAWLASNLPQPSAVVRVAGPNAGHSAVDYVGRKWALRQVPVAAVADPYVELMLGAGSEIDPAVLESEVDQLEDAGFSVRNRLWIDGQATLIEHTHVAAERTMVDRIGSTGKGVGAARAARLRREAATWADWATVCGDAYPYNPPTDTAARLRAQLRDQLDVVIEGTQGYGLGLHAGYYPYCTSSDCRAIDFLAMAGLSPWMAGTQVNVWPVFRTFPIRVAGNSGPMVNEMTWEMLSQATDGYIQPERTTVTQKVRRVGGWDGELATRAMHANGFPSTSLFPVLTFVDYVFPQTAGLVDYEKIDAAAAMELDRYLESVRGDLCGIMPAALGTGPSSMIQMEELPF